VRCLPAFFLTAVLAGAGCAGARVNVTADQSRYAISMSQVVRDQSGQAYDRNSLYTVGRLEAGRTRMGYLYSGLTILSTIDISEEVNQQVAAVGGEAVIGMTVMVSAACDVLNVFPILNIIPIWPGCVPVTVTGEIVRRRPAPSAAPQSPPTADRTP
jgi:hypothetical protein